MKNLFRLTMIILTLLPLLVYPQFKQLEKSGKKPGWVNELREGYIIGHGRGQTLDIAKDQAMLDVRRQISEAVAIHVKSVSESLVRELILNEKTSMASEFEEMTQTQTGKRDYLMGISASRVEDFFWEEVRNKRTKEQFFKYALLYPFSDKELDNLVSIFKEKDRKLTELLESLLSITESYKTIEELESCKARLEKLAPLFIDERKARAEVGVQKCINLLKSVYIADTNSEPGHLRYSLKVGNRLVSTAKKPRFQTNCATLGRRLLGHQVNELFYSTENCYDEPGNHITVYYRTSYKSISRKFPLNSEAGKVSLKIEGAISLFPADGKVRCRVISEYDTPAIITGLELSNEKLGVFISEMTKERIAGKGTHTIDFSTQPFKIDKSYTSAELNGYINYRSEQGGEDKSIRIYRNKSRIIR